jgi:hypothetical protein
MEKRSLARRPLYANTLKTTSRFVPLPRWPLSDRQIALDDGAAGDLSAGTAGIVSH